MKNRILKAGIFAVSVLSINGTYAGQADTNYAGLQYIFAAYNADGISEEFNPSGLAGSFGRFFHTNFSIEGRLGIGLDEDLVSVSGSNVNMDLDYLIGVYGVGHFNITKSVSVYGLVGYTKAEASFSSPDFDSTSEDGSDLSYGLGADIFLGRNVSLNIEYTQYLSESDFDMSVFGFGVKYGF